MKLVGESSMGEEIASQSDEVGAVSFDVSVNFAAEVLQSPLSCNSQVYNN
jgi:hypothetical protein